MRRSVPLKQNPDRPLKRTDLGAAVDAARAERESRPEWPIIRKLYEAERLMLRSGARELVRQATVELELLSAERAARG